MKFKHKTTGVVLSTENLFTIEQLKKNVNYEEIKETKKKSTEKAD